MTTRLEEWKPVPLNEYKDFYDVSNMGRVRSKHRKHFGNARILKPHFNRGYCMTALSKPGGPHRSFYIHHLVLTAFTGERNGRDTHHINFKKNDNRVSNLMWVTPKENVRFNVKSKKHPHGITNGMAKLTEEQVKAIRFMHANQKVTCRLLGKAFNMGQSSMGHILSGRSWKHIARAALSDSDEE